MPVKGNIICDHCGLKVLKKNYARHKRTKRCIDFNAATHFGRRERRIRLLLAKKKTTERNKNSNRKAPRNNTGQHFFITTQRCLKYRVAKYMNSPLFTDGAPEYIQQLIVCNEYGCSMRDGHSHLYIKTKKKMRLQDLKQYLKVGLENKLQRHSIMQKTKGHNQVLQQGRPELPPLQYRQRLAGFRDTSNGTRKGSVFQAAIKQNFLPIH